MLLVGALVTLYLVELLLSRSPHRIEVFEGYELAARVLAPAGAMVIAVSLAIRALTRPFSRLTPGTQLVVGIALLADPCRDHRGLGATANAGILLVEVLARVIGLTALPLGIALLATQPLVRLAHTRQAYSLPAGPPDIETLD
ncbi:MAG TPA: hypothetical protein VES02_12620 [Dermatophilaceae bacterium]|nr:hypothetical protein [Dermatophilaceae bacterium]